MRTWRFVGLAAALALTATVIATNSAGCEKRTAYVGQTTVYAAPPPAMVAVPAPPQAQPGPPPPAPAPMGQAQPPPPPQVQQGQPAPEAPAGAEVLTQGPIHEAFAEPVAFNAEPGIIVPRTPPAAVEEIPPDERPEGAVWIPGYWAWDDDRTDFIWISGIWRVPPPNCSWVPGYWTQTTAGWQWTSGFWQPAQGQEIQYLPQPPASLEIGPSAPPPSEDHIWASGSWNWASTRYVWRPGYWMVARPYWIWSPAHFVWTPRGYIYVDGYWDYTIEDRGVMFAPVYFGGAGYGPGFYYSPTVVVSAGVFTTCLWARPRYGHYYFGDYYDTRYMGFGFYAWFDVHRHHHWYDPVYEHYRWRHHRDDPRWEEHLRDQYSHRRDDPSLRPPHTFAAQQQELLRHPERAKTGDAVAAKYKDVVTANKGSDRRFEQLTGQRRQEIAQESTKVRKYAQDRAAWETKGAGKAPKIEQRADEIAAKPPKNARIEELTNKPPKTNRSDLTGSKVTDVGRPDTVGKDVKSGRKADANLTPAELKKFEGTTPMPVDTKPPKDAKPPKKSDLTTDTRRAGTPITPPPEISGPEAPFLPPPAAVKQSKEPKPAKTSVPADVRRIDLPPPMATVKRPDATVLPPPVSLPPSAREIRSSRGADSPAPPSVSAPAPLPRVSAPAPLPRVIAAPPQVIAPPPRVIAPPPAAPERVRVPQPPVVGRAPDVRDRSERAVPSRPDTSARDSRQPSGGRDRSGRGDRDLQ